MSEAFGYWRQIPDARPVLESGCVRVSLWVNSYQIAVSLGTPGAGKKADQNNTKADIVAGMSPVSMETIGYNRLPKRD